MGRDVEEMNEAIRGAVSIHAPAWGATRRAPRGIGMSSFNPRARVGRDLSGADRTAKAAVSIHAPAWGATGSRPVSAPAGRSFNPRARVGRDDALVDYSGG